MSGALKPASCKPAPRVHLVQGNGAALPMHLVRPAFAPVLPPPAKVDGNTGGSRNPRNTIPVAMLLLLERGLTSAELYELLRAQFPASTILVDRLLGYLVKAGNVVVDDQDRYGLTDTGTKVAERTKRERGADINAHAWRTLDKPPAPHIDATPLPVVHATSLAGAGSPPRMQSSTADTRPAPVRQGADAGLQLPSRVGDTLRYRSGLVTDMAGTVLQAATSGQITYRPTHIGQERARPAFESNH